mgnify:CR=1 FL=1
MASALPPAEYCNSYRRISLKRQGRLPNPSLLDRGKSSGRTDDLSKEIISNRIKEYNLKTVPLKSFYSQQNKLYEVDGFGSIEEIREKVPFDLVLSVMAPNISGIRETDDAQMIYLVENVLSIIDRFLKKGGSTLIKVFQGESLDYTRNALSDRFKTCKVSKPSASRSNSKETYLIGKELIK